MQQKNGKGGRIMGKEARKLNKRQESGKGRMKREINTGQRKGDRTMEKEIGQWKRRPENGKRNRKVGKET